MILSCVPLSCHLAKGNNGRQYPEAEAFRLDGTRWNERDFLGTRKFICAIAYGQRLGFARDGPGHITH
jgi:hypothetical protein